MALRAVFFDVGETLVDERRYWREVAALAGLPVDVIGSSASWGVRKPSQTFFERLVAETGFERGEVAYVGDRVDNDVEPAAEAGLVAIWLRRGPWGLLQRDTDAAALMIHSLAEVPAALTGL